VLDQGPIADCLRTLAGELQEERGHAARVLDEVRDHLEESAGAFEAEGLDPAAAERQAVEQFGEPHAMAALLRRRSQFESFTRGLVTLGVLGCFAVAAWLFSVLYFVHPLRDRTQSELWTLVMVEFVAYGAFCAWHLARPHEAVKRWVLAITALPFFVLGCAGVYSQVARAARGGDFEGYIVLMSAGLAVQATAVVLHLLATRRLLRPA
jgi:hypothetical protein